MRLALYAVQAQAAAKFLKETAISEGLNPSTYYAAIYSSPLKRANQTARIIANTLGQDGVQIVNDVREWNLGMGHDKGAWDYGAIDDDGQRSFATYVPGYQPLD
jgi:broad specificity phosphatase PhoE